MEFPVILIEFCEYAPLPIFIRSPLNTELSEIERLVMALSPSPMMIPSDATNLLLSSDKSVLTPEPAPSIPFPRLISEFL